MASPHDALFKYVFAQPEHAASEFRALFPAAFSERLEWSSLQLEPASFVDEQLRARQADLLFSVRCQGQPAYVYVLLEHQSTSDPIMAFRLLRYLVRIWDAVLAKHPGGERLPAIIPLVVYHGRTPWAAPTDLRDLIGLDPLALRQVEEYLPQLRFLLDDLSATDEAALRRRPLTPEAALALVLLSRARGEAQLLGVLRRWRDVLARLSGVQRDTEALTAFWVYALQVGDMRPQELASFAEEIDPAAREAYVTAAEVLEARAEARGKAQGRIEGKVEGKVEVIVRLIRLKFGEVPDGLRRQLSITPAVELDAWADRIISAATLDELL